MVKNILFISSLAKLCNVNFISLENQGLRWWVKPSWQSFLSERLKQFLISVLFMWSVFCFHSLLLWCCLWTSGQLKSISIFICSDNAKPVIGCFINRTWNKDILIKSLYLTKQIKYLITYYYILMAYDIFEANYIYKPSFKMNFRSESFLSFSSSKV